MQWTRYLPVIVVAGTVSLLPGCSRSRTDWRQDPAPASFARQRCVEQPPGKHTHDETAGNKQVVEIAPPEERNDASFASGRTLVGDWPHRPTRRIDVSFHRTSLHNAFRFFAEVTRLNVVVADEVRGEVTMELRHVPWLEAFRAVLEVEQLVAIKEGNVIRVLRRADLKPLRRR